MMEGSRSLEETPTWSVASVTTVMVFLCLFVERSIYRCGRWLKKTRRKALFSSLEKIKEELMLLGLISLLLGQCARWISQICVDSSLFSSKFYQCSNGDYETTTTTTTTTGRSSTSFLLTFLRTSENETLVSQGISFPVSHSCGEGREPFVSYEGLEQLHRFLFVLGITHVLYSFLAVGLAMSKIYSWRKWEIQAPYVNSNVQAKNKVMRRQSTFALHHASHPWSRSRVLIWMLCFLKQFRSSIQKSDYLALRLGFITNHGLPHTYNFHKYMVRSMEDEFYCIVGISWPLWGYAIICIFINIHGLNTYFWLSFIPAILVMVVGTKQQHVVSLLALETTDESTSSSIATQVKPRDELFWLGKPDILLRLIQFISFQNAFEMATFIWSLWAFKHRCFMKNHAMVAARLISGILVQFWCSYSTVPLNVIIIQMGSRCKKALIAESVRDSLHSWCKRVKARSKLSIATRSVCSVESTIDEIDEEMTIASGTVSPSSSSPSSSDGLNQLEDNDEDANARPEGIIDSANSAQHEFSLRVTEYLSQAIIDGEDDDAIEEEAEEEEEEDEELSHPDTLLELFKRT